MEIRVDNTITIEQVRALKLYLDEFFVVDLSIAITGDYIYYRDR